MKSQEKPQPGGPTPGQPKPDKPGPGQPPPDIPDPKKPQGPDIPDEVPEREIPRKPSNPQSEPSPEARIAEQDREDVAERSPSLYTADNESDDRFHDWEGSPDLRDRFPFPNASIF